MTEGDLPEAVERLLSRDLENYEQIEALLLLVKNPHRPFGAEEVGEKLGVPDDAALAALDHLRRRGLVDATTASGKMVFSYGSMLRDLDGAVQALALVYRDKPVEVAKKMTANAINRVRTAAIRTFSDAFLVRKKKDDG